MNTLNGAKWIWDNPNASADEHADFFSEFEYHSEDGQVFLSIAADSDFGVYVNGVLEKFGQYPDYPHYKVYDRFDITSVVREGKNTLAIEVWYLGNNCSTNIDDGAGLCFSLDSEKGNLLKSDKTVRSRISKVYRNHACLQITDQLGFGYGYDATAEDDWKEQGGADFTPSAEVTPEKPLPRVLRPIEHLVTEAPVVGTLIKEEHGETHRYLFDFGCELVGVYRIRFFTENAQNTEICYGEHIADGWVRDQIGGRRFAFDYKASAGENDYCGYLRRLALRYAELRTEQPIERITFEILPRSYPVKERPFSCGDAELEQIYRLCVRTLRLCMHEHYEDCPWREQAMYVMDSRNQMLCGYYAFEEYAFPRACLKLIAEDRRKDDMLSITYPGANGLVIPSFGLHFFTAVREYGEHSGDWAFVEEIYPKLERVLGAFLKRYSEKDHLLKIFKEPCYWNFYEWANGLSGSIGNTDEEQADLILNALFSIALRNMQEISVKLGKECACGRLSDEVNAAINQRFKNEQTLLYGMYDAYGGYSELGNALAVLCGAADERTAKRLCEMLTDDESDLVRISLSMKCFKYDALLRVDKEKYTEYIIRDIRRVYRKMLDYGSTTAWETEAGERDFGNAGSLCHGWSALPVYYFRKLLK